MKLISLTDLHGKKADIQAILKQSGPVDLIVISGDITHFGGRLKARFVLRPLMETGIAVLAVSGNCDLPGTASWLEEKDIHLHGRMRSVQSMGFVGAGGSLPCPMRTPNEMSEAEFESALNAGLAQGQGMDAWILVSHQPPYGTLNDALADGRHVGSHAVRRFIEQHQPLLCFTGHIHEGAGVDEIGRTQVVNPGPAREGGYGFVEIEGDRVSAEIRKI